MQIDMLIIRFFAELRRLYPSGSPFQMQGEHSAAACAPALPPYRAMFSGCCMRSYSEGYRLPHIDIFISDFLTVIKTKMSDPKHGVKLRAAKNNLFMENGEPTPGLLHRLCSRYRDGMAHTHLYCVLAQAYEDQRKLGTVLMDPRVDIKMKTDITIAGHGRIIRVDIGQGSKALLASRAQIEDKMKQNAGGSSQKGNPFLLNPVVRVLSHQDAMRDYLGLRVFGEEAIDLALHDIDILLGVEDGKPPRYRDMARVRSCDLPGARA